MKSLTFIEIDVSFCSHVYGVAPCTAAIPTTGEAKCFNSIKTCQDRDNYGDDDVTLRFAKDASYLAESGIEAFPNVLDVQFTPATISLGENLGQRATLTVTFKDHPHSDSGAGFDKYRAERSYDAFAQGSFWGKFRARQPFLQGRAIRWISGTLDQALEDMTTRHFLIESFDGPTPDGKYTLIAKDVLKLVDGDRAQAPILNSGYLATDIVAAATSLTLAPTGVGDLEYPLEGKLNLGGKEIVAFTRFTYDPLRNDAATKILLRFDGSNGSTTITDANLGGSAHTWTASSAALNTSVKKFGTASLLTTAGYVSTPDHADFTFGGGDLTVDFWLNCNGTSGAAYLCGQGTSAGSTSAASFYIARTAANKIEARLCIGSGGPIATSTTSVNDSTWRHIAMVRTGNILRLFINGVQEGGDQAASGSANDSSGDFAVGRWGALTTVVSSCYFDQFRLTVGVARWTANFTPPAADYTDGDLKHSTGDVVTLTARAQLNTVAADFKAQDRVQVVLSYASASVADILYDLFTNYSAVDPDWITLEDWQTEAATFLSRLYSANIPEPTSVASLISELILQGCLVIWWDDVAQKIRLQVLRGVVTDAALFTPDNTLEGSLTVKEQPDKRISQVWVYFGQINPLKQLSETDNYRSSAIAKDDSAELDYGSAVIKKINSRWIPALGRSVADRLGTIQLGRYRDPPRRVTFDLQRYASTDAVLGGGYRVQAQSIQNADGSASEIPVQVTRLNAPEDRFKVEAEEVIYVAAAEDLSTRAVIVDTDTYNVDLRAAHDLIYPAPESGNLIVCRIRSGVVVGSHSTTLPALDIGTWPGGVTVKLVVEGRLQGKGGLGGRGWSPPYAVPTAGQKGGLALYTRQALTLELPAGGKIWGGGGGGSGGGSGDGLGYGGYGGGGAGREPGLAGGGFALPGTDTAGGAKSNGVGSTYAWPGSDGGDPGQPGDARTGTGTVPSSLPGAAGEAIDGVSYVTTTVTGGEILGPTIN